MAALITKLVVVKSAERIVFSTHQRALQISSAFSHIARARGEQNHDCEKSCGNISTWLFTTFDSSFLFD